MTVKIMSPTGITQSVPRPKSPRRPDQYGHRGRSGARNDSRSRSTPFVAAQAFQKAYGTGQGPRIRRRSHQQMGRFPGARGQQDPPARSDPRACVSGMHDLIGMNNNAAACVGKSVDLSKEYAIRYGPTAKDNIVKCTTATAQGVTEVAVVAADIYRQECKTNNRGDDSLFFMDSQDRGVKETNSMMDTLSSSSDEPIRTPSKEARNDKSNRKKSDDPEPVFRSPRSMRFPEAIHVMKDPAADLDNISPPPRVDRVDASKVWPKSLHQPQAPHGQEDHTNLREARLQLFKTDNSDGTEQAARLSRALEDLNRQDQIITRLQRELNQSNEQLEKASEELGETRSVSQQRQFTATEVRARAVQERKKLEDALQRETENNRKLQTMISQMQGEASGLKMALRNARNDGMRKARQPGGTIAGDKDKNPQSPSPELPAASQNPLDSALMPSVITMRAEIVELRAQLAEARAAGLELKQVRAKLESAEKEAVELRRKQLEVGRFEDRHKQTEGLLRDKLEKAEASSKEARVKLETKLKDVIESENTIKAELIKTKASLHRLERERSQKKLKLASESDRMNKQVSIAKQEADKLKKQLSDEREAHRLEVQSLRAEVADIKQKLSQAGQDSLLKNTEYIKERRKLQKDVTSQSQEVKSLKEKIASKDDKIKKLQAQRGSGSVASGSAVQQLRDEIRLRKANEAALRAEIKIQKKLVEQAGADADQVKRNRGLGDKETHKEEIEELKRKIARFETSKEKNEAAAILAKAAVTETKLLWEIDELKKTISKLQDTSNSSLATDNAKEQAYLNDICVLKASLSEAEEKCREEKFRADEERRISRETEAERVAEIVRLRKEKDELCEKEARRVEEIEDLKRKIGMSPSLVSSSGRNARSWSVPAAASNDSTRKVKVHSAELPENVLRLRKELALARARLAAAREDSQTVGLDSPSPSSPDKSTDSGVSSWAPPGIVRRHIDTREAKLPSVTASRSEQPTFSENASTKRGVFNLQEQLLESSKRLSVATSRLQGFVKTGDTHANEPKQISQCENAADPFPEPGKLPDTVLTVVRVDSNDDSSVSVTSGVIEEVKANPSGNIEVSERRFFDM